MSEEELVQLIDDSISIRSLFEPRVQSPFMLSWDGVSLSAKFDNIMSELLPDAKPLELSKKKETDEYREMEEAITHSSCQMSATARHYKMDKGERELFSKDLY